MACKSVPVSGFVPETQKAVWSCVHLACVTGHSTQLPRASRGLCGEEGGRIWKTGCLGSTSVMTLISFVSLGLVGLLNQIS